MSDIYTVRKAANAVLTELQKYTKLLIYKKKFSMGQDECFKIGCHVCRKPLYDVWQCGFGLSPEGWNRYSLRQRTRNQYRVRQMQPVGLRHHARARIRCCSPTGCWSLPSLSPVWRCHTLYLSVPFRHTATSNHEA